MKDMDIDILDSPNGGGLDPLGKPHYLWVGGCSSRGGGGEQNRTTHEGGAQNFRRFLKGGILDG